MLVFGAGIHCFSTLFLCLLSRPNLRSFPFDVRSDSLGKFRATRDALCSVIVRFLPCYHATRELEVNDAPISKVAGFKHDSRFLAMLDGKIYAGRIKIDRL